MGLGEAVPLVAARWHGSWPTVVEELQRLGGVRSAGRDDPARRRGSVLPALVRCAALTALLDLRGEVEQLRIVPQLRPPHARFAATRPSTAGYPALVVSAAEHWAARRLLHLQAEARDGMMLPRCGRYAKHLDHGPGSGSTPTLPGTWRPRSGHWANWSPTRSSLPSSRWRRWRRRWRSRGSTSIPLAGDESIESRADAERPLRQWRPVR